MPTRSKKTARAFGHDALPGLEYLVKELNSRIDPSRDTGGKGSFDRMALAFREVVAVWQRSGPNTAKLLIDHPDLWGELIRVWRPSLAPTKGGAAVMNFVHPAEPKGTIEAFGPKAIRSRALVLLAALMLNPLCERLAGPCARCGDYYVKKRVSQKVYCSRKCGNAATALKRTRERLEAERREKLARATRAIQQWKRSRTPLDWKSWVGIKAKLDPRFITRAVTNGDLVPPKKGR